MTKDLDDPRPPSLAEEPPGLDLSDLSRSYPFLHLSRKMGVPYALVLDIASRIDRGADPADYWGSDAYHLSRQVAKVCSAPWRRQFPPQGRGL